MLTAEKVAWFLDLLLHLPAFPLFVAYLAMVFLAPVYTRLTRPWEIPKAVLVLHNASCCLLSAAALALFCRAFATEPGYASVFETRPGREFQPAFAIYHLGKAVELADTLVIVARHRTRQLSFLHVYHHASMLLLSNLASARYPWIGVGFYLGLNSLLHVFLYLYYAVAACRPDASVAWRRRLTQAQIAQFLLGLLYSTYGYARHGYCLYGQVYGASLTGLFGHFYYRAYLRPLRSGGGGGGGGGAKPSARGKTVAATD